MKHFFHLLIILMMSFVYADCSEIDNQEDCERMEHCEWSENAGCIEGDSDDDGALENNYPLSYSLSQNYPNPFNPVTKIDFSIAESSHITLKIYDISGKEVSKLINEFYSAGNYTIKWDATDAYGKQLSAGIYIYQLNTKNGLFSNTMVLMK